VVAAGGFDDARQFWDQRFASEDYVFGTAPNAFLASQSQLFKPRVRVLDLACGEGRNAVWLAQQGCEVVAIDISPVAIEKARRLAAARGVHVAFELVDVRDWHWPPRAFDAVVSIFIQFAAPAERAELFAGFVATLRPNGVLVLQGYTPKQLQYKTGGPPQAEHMYTAAMLREATAGLEIVHIREHDDVLSEGTKHVGLSALIDLVARKPA
jgi:cyclopropane fatty-acyl-phospholipid synthase-like methyltransferase